MIVTYHTENSTYDFDEETGVYRRSPRTIEQEIESDKLVYGEWLPLKSYEILIDGEDYEYLHIMHEDSVIGIFTSRLVDP